MIPVFPNFKKLELTDKKEVEKITSKFPPYSDFNFVSLWTWDVKNQVFISILNENLVVLFTDYITGERFCSFLGNNKVKETIKDLLEFSKNKNFKPVLKLVPDEVINTEMRYSFNVTADPDSYDYIYAVSHLSNMHNWPQHSSGKNVRSYSRNFPNYVIKHCSVGKAKKDEYIKIFKKWAENKEVKNYSKLNEYQALERFFELKQENTRIVSVYVDNILMGFNIYEIVSSDYAISHFAKVNIKHHRAIGDILNWEEAKILNNLGIKYFNWEQDLGILNLRKSKEKYKSDFLLKKVTISYKK